MDEERLRKYIELQQNLINAYAKMLKNVGVTMDVINSKKEIQAFEDSLDCNQVK